jgi:tRNA A-37 threonylcarbamoyl transferase component Bud32
MEFVKLFYIASCELSKYVITKKFDTESFWHKCIHVNIIYTKFFQAIAAKYNIHTAVHSIPYREDEILLPKDMQLTKIMGSGLISIVFEGLVDEKQVVIKTKRRNIDLRVRNSLETIRSLLTCINYVYKIPILISTYYDVADLFYTQLDFGKELENHKKFHTMFSNTSICIPTLYENYCSTDQLVMTKLEGIPLNTLTEKQRKTCISNIIQLIGKSLFDYGFLHADLHVGNIIFQDETIGILDFGLMLQLTPTEKELIYKIFQAISTQDYSEAAVHTLEFIGPYEVKSSLDPYVMTDIHAFIVHTYKKAIYIHKSFTVHDIIELTQKLNQHGLVLSGLFPKLILALNSVESVLTKLSITPTELMYEIMILLIKS